ncbi:EF-hand domain pair [Phytophthora cinnamomi]|uniref:EF-hand domain pair n=1 Tax=Phytophthora cinnamomi TaxID=4785 RepID=UPI00355A004C|nr:EF-hand domain pair [Phytophthora cinnamomi]
MDIVQASFQASFDSRVERLGDVDLADLRVIFRYFDTDGDGAVSADQACRMFALLGLDVNTAQVRELGEVYLNEFIKIVDSHVHAATPAVAAAEAPEAVEAPAGDAQAPAPPETPVSTTRDTERRLRNEKVLEDEWKLLDTYRRGRVSMQELRLFLASVQSTLSPDDAERFLETYGNAIEYDGGEELELTKEGFLKFRHEYTPKKMALSEDDESSDDDDEHDLRGHAGLVGQRAHETVNSTEASEAANSANGAASKRLPSRHAERGPSDDTQSSNDHMLSLGDHEFVVNPDELVESDESDEEAAAGNNDLLSAFDDGHDTARS